MHSGGLLRPPFKLETPGGVRSVAWQSGSAQATIKGSDQTARMRRLIRGFAGRTYHIVLAHILTLRMRREEIDSFGTRENTQAEHSFYVNLANCEIS